MDRENIYAKWEKIKKKNGKIIFGLDSIKRLHKLSDQNLYYFDNFFESFITSNSVNNIPTYRSKILDFLEHLEHLNINLPDITQEIIDEYLEQYKTEKSLQTRVDYLKKFFSYFSLEQIDFDKSIYKNNQNKIDNKISRISAEKISKAKDIYRIIRKENEGKTDEEAVNNYKNATKKLFVLEMFLYTPLSMEKIGDFWKQDGKPFDEENIYLYDYDEKYRVPKSLISLMTEMCESDMFYEPNDIATTVNNMRRDLSRLGINNITSKNAEKTTNAIFWTCPQCGKKFEAIALNWSVKQYTENGEYWVVCRENCGHE